tara:strand:- start:297 stop:878 length:582 start_codon:yes stop_codon:yes gene_type:complete
MNKPLLYAILFCSITVNLVADDAVATKAAAAGPPTVQQRYLVTLVEYHLEDILSPSLSESEIIALIEKQNAEAVETIRLSALEGVESMAQFGRRVTATTGTMTVRGITERRTEAIQVGSIIRLTAIAKDHGVEVKIDFEASRLAGKGDDDSPPDISTSNISTSLIVVPGKWALLGATSSGESSYVLLSVANVQ